MGGVTLRRLVAGGLGAGFRRDPQVDANAVTSPGRINAAGEGLSTTPASAGLKRSTASLLRLDGSLAIEGHQLSNAALFELLDA
jgi:hypothetical protein